MPKRKLTRRQQWRIDKIQQERLQRSRKKELSLDEHAGDLGPEQTGLVIAHYGVHADIEALEPPLAGQVFRCHLRANLKDIVTGDEVAWRPGQETAGVVVAVFDRHSRLARPDNTGQLRTVAANIDNIYIVIAPQPLTPAGLIDRYLVAAEALDIPATLVLNKADLLDDIETSGLSGSLKEYVRIGYPVIHTSTKSESGLNALKQSLATQTSIFVGQSGVGKSSLVNALLPEINTRVGGLSEATGKGTHTTTTAQLFHLPEGGRLIDSPGIREFGLWHIDETTLAQGFIEFRPHLGRCKFRDCRHAEEPGCALLAAAEKGDISARRMRSFKQLRQALIENS